MFLSQNLLLASLVLPLLTHLEAAMLLKSLLRAKTLLSMFPWAQPCIAPGFQGIPQFEPQLGAIQLFLIAPLGYQYSNM